MLLLIDINKKFNNFFLKNTWLVNKIKYPQTIFNLLSYYDYLLKFNPLILPTSNFFLVQNTNFDFYTIKYFLRQLNLQSHYSNENTRTRNKFLKIKTKTLLKNKTKASSTKFVLKNTTNKVFINFDITGEISYFFNVFFLMNQVPLMHQQSLHHNLYLYGISKTRTKIVTVEPRKFFKKWQQIHLLLSNLCYFNQIPLIYSSAYFKRETVSLN
jgi:hypothetical protein